MPEPLSSIPRPPLRIVLTGAPGSGKSTIAREISRRHPGRFVIVPEAATQYYTALGRRWNQLDTEQQRAAQRGIYHLQISQEERIATKHPHETLLMDRGTIDGSAYWPDGPDAYWQDLGMSEAEQLARYSLVIVLESAAAIGLYDGDASNAVRFEKAAEALENGKLLARLWSAHPHTHLIRAEPDFARKVAAVEQIICGALADER